MLKFFANTFWIYTPGIFQKVFSRFFSSFFRIRISRFFIIPYCIFFGLGSDYLDQFESESGESAYNSYSDFFKRRYRMTPKLDSNVIWPCEGYLCDWGKFSQKNNSIVKGHVLDLNAVFASDKTVTQNYFFMNIFLHNHNYHRVHAPISGRINQITRIPGDLVFLRPWFYKRDEISYPAIRNERVIFELTDTENRPWYIAMVGGFGVGSIEIVKDIGLGIEVMVGQEIAKFNLGSTVCLATPLNLSFSKFLDTVSVGQNLPII